MVKQNWLYTVPLVLRNRCQGEIHVHVKNKAIALRGNGERVRKERQYLESGLILGDKDEQNILA